MTRNGSSAEKAKLLIRLDANHEIGLAHAIRVAAILRLLEIELDLTIAGNGQLITAFFPGARLVQASVENLESFVSLVDAVTPDLILVDHPRPGATFWQALRNSASKIPVVAIDDEGGDVEADLIINGTVLDEYHHYPSLAPNSRLLLGRKYSLIRPEFSTSPWRDPEQKAVVIVVGSADRARDWALLLSSGVVDIRTWGQVTMIVGWAFPEMATLQQNCSSLGISLASGLSGEKMATTLARASIALTTGGMIVYEALAVGVPAIVFPQIENLIPEANWFAQRGCIEDLGFAGGMNSQIIGEMVDKLLSDPSARQLMSMAQRATIDGQGMARVAKEICLLLNQKSGFVGSCPQA